MIRRAGVRTAYSQGFHPKPDMTYGPALSLGIASLDEYLDAKLIDAPDAATLVARLNEAAAGGLRFTGAVELGPNDPALSRIITGARYVIALAGSALGDIGGRAVLEARVQAFLEAETAPVRRNIKGIGKIVDVRSYVTALSIGGDAARALLREAGLIGSMVPLEVEVRLGPSGATKVAEIVEVVTGDAAFPHQAVRTALLASGASPLDVDAHRRPQPAKSTPGAAEASA